MFKTQVCGLIFTLFVKEPFVMLYEIINVVWKSKPSEDQRMHNTNLNLIGKLCKELKFYV
jgi:hypothetical protein